MKVSYPDLILWSTETRQAMLIELIVPSEENIEVASERKLEKYQELVEQCKSNKWWAACYPIEIGRKVFMQNSESNRYNRRQKKSSKRFRNRLKKGYGLKDQKEWVNKKKERKQRIDLVFPMYIYMYKIDNVIICTKIPIKKAKKRRVGEAWGGVGVK